MSERARSGWHLNLRKKILLLCMITWIGSVLAIGGVAISSQIENSRSREIREDVANLAVARQSMQLQLERVNLAGIRFSQQESVSKLLSRNFEMLDSGEGENILVSLDLLFFENPYVAMFGTGPSVAFFSSDGRSYYNDSMLLKPYVAEEAPFTLRPVIDQSLQSYGFTIGQNVTFRAEGLEQRLQYRRSFRLQGEDSGGALVMLLPENMAKDAFPKVEKWKSWMILDQKLQIAAHEDPELPGRSLAEAYEIPSGQLTGERGSLRGRRDGKACLINYCTDEKYGLIYAYAMPVGQIYASCREIVASVAVAEAVAVLVLVFLSWYLSHRFTEPLEKLGGIMVQAEQGDLDVRMHPQLDDEIGVMGKRFDRMLARLQQSMESIRRVEHENRLAELRILELQINPHFLYNTLSSIIWLASENQDESIIDLTKSLALFYRKALSEGQEEIPVADELTMIQNYVNIMSYRYQENLRVEYDIAPGLEEYRILKLLLQPLVENSIHHGILNLEDQQGRILIQGERRRDCLVFRVCDNGGALDQTEVLKLNRAIREGRSGIGTTNVHGRLSCHYGTAYGLEYSCTDGWTIAKITLPARKEKS